MQRALGQYNRPRPETTSGKYRAYRRFYMAYVCLISLIECNKKTFQFPIPRCDDTITILGNGAGNIWIIRLDARQRYHQISVREVDREKIAFYAPDDKNYTFNVMHLVPQIPLHSTQP